MTISELTLKSSDPEPARRFEVFTGSGRLRSSGWWRIGWPTSRNRFPIGLRGLLLRRLQRWVSGSQRLDFFDKQCHDFGGDSRYIDRPKLGFYRVRKPNQIAHLDALPDTKVNQIIACFWISLMGSEPRLSFFNLLFHLNCILII